MALSPKTRLGWQTSSGKALRRIMVAAGTEVAAQLDRVMTSEDPEGPHAARVALRRIRAVLQGFSPLIDKTVLAAQKAEARRLFRMIGTLRDADVRAEHLARLGVRADGTDERDQIRNALRAALAASHAETYGPELCRLFLSSDWKRRGRKARHWQKAPLHRLATRALNRAWSDCAAFGSSVRAMPQADRHALRKTLKPLRYLAEYFQGLWPGKAGADFLGRLRTLQDQLGILNDIALLDTVADAEPDPALRAEQDARTAEALDKAERIWRKLRKGSLYWT